MTPSLEAKLVAKYPEIFKDYKGDPSKTCMAYGIAVGDGWFDLIDTMCEELTRSLKSAEFHLKRLKLYHPTSLEKIALQEKKVEKERSLVPVAAQVKEKFGGLRFYVEEGTQEHYAIIDFAENISYKLCEECGNKGKLYTLGWHKTLCPDHALKQYGQEAMDKLLTQVVLPK